MNAESASPRYSGFAIEKLVSIMLCNYISKQGKEVTTNYTSMTSNGIREYDVYAPEGFDEYNGKTVLEIKLVRYKNQYKKMLHNTIKRFNIPEDQIENLIIILIGESLEDIDKEFLTNNDTRTKISIWTTEKLLKIFYEDLEFFSSTYDNLYELLIKDTINQGMKKDPDDYKKVNDLYIGQLKEEYHKDNLVLFLGAGVSYDAKIPTWDVLISELFVALINKEMKKEGIELDDYDKEIIVNSIQNQNGNSPLLQTRFLRQGFREDFSDLVRNILYKESISTSPLLKELCQLCVPRRGKIGIKAIINYNFDDLLERNLKNLRVETQSVYSEGVKVNSGELGIYHVHGFLPQYKEEYKNLSNSLFVFSEEGYHKLLLEPYNWSNMTQLNYLVNDVCLFVGLSMTDPNLRRLLEISAQKNIEEKPPHYAILKRSTIIDDNKVSESVKKFNKVNEELQKSFFNELGVNIIWIDDYSEIPTILQEIKK